MNINSVLSILMILLYGTIVSIFYLKAKSSKTKVVTSILLGLFFSIFAYNFQPRDDFDLVRHHATVARFENIEDIDGFIYQSKKNDLEILPQIYSYAISKTENKNLLQAILVLVGYSLLFYMLVDYREKKNIKNLYYIPLVFLVIFGQHILFYFSGLYNYFAINLFSFAFYCDYVKSKKMVPHVLYFLSVFIHSSMLLPLGLLYLFKLLRSKINLKIIIALALCLLSFDVAVGVFAELFNSELLINARNTYSVYISHNSSMLHLYDGFYMFMTVTKALLVLMACWIHYKDKGNKNVMHFSFVLFVAVFILSFSSIAMTRFSSLLLFIAYPIIADAVSKNTNHSRFLSVLVVISATLYTVYSIHVMVPLISIGGGI